MPFDRNMSNDVFVGARVFSLDGGELGTVREVVGRSFKVDAPLRRDFWLSVDSVREASPGEVHLAFDAAHADDFKRDGPTST